jgi:hypothetical protein
MIGFKNGEIVHVPFSKIIKQQKSVEESLIKMAEILSV